MKNRNCVFEKAWFQSPNAADTPKNDLNLLMTLENYESVHENVAQVALRKIKLHLWYLSEYVAPLSFFSDISDNEKAQLVAALKT